MSDKMKMDDMARECMNHLAIIQEAQKALNGELNRMWDEIKGRIQKEIDDICKSCNVLLPIDRNESSAGHFRTEPMYQTGNKQLPRISIEVRDPRQSRISESYEVKIFWSGRKKVFKNIQGAKERLDELAKAEVVHLSAPAESDICQKVVKVNTSNLDETIAEVGEAIVSYYRITTGFLKWLRDRKEP